MPHKILYIEDEEQLRMLIVAQLSFSGFQAEGTGSGIEGIEMIARNHHDLVLLDLHMPGMNGSQVVEELRKRNLSPKLVVITGDSPTEAQAATSKLGANASISKPFHFQQLLDLINAQLG